MIDHVQIACPPGSEPVLRDFYIGVLGLTEKPKPPLLAARGGCWFIGYGIELHLGVEAGFGEACEPNRQRSHPARKAHPGLLWPDLDGLAARLTAAGYPVHWADPAEIPGRRRFHTADPHGNRLEFLAPTDSMP